MACRSARLVLPALLLLLMLPGLAWASSQDRWIVRVPFPLQGEASPLRATGTEVLKQLASCLVVRTDADGLEAMAAAGLAPGILVPADAGRFGAFVALRSAEDVLALNGRGTLLQLEDRTGLWFPEGADPLPESIPDGIFWSPLGDRAVVFHTQGELALMTQPLPTLTATPDPNVTPLVTAVSQDNLRTYDTALANYGTRYFSKPAFTQAGQYIYDFFSSHGIPVAFENYSVSYGGKTYSTRNVVARISGQTTPERKVVLGAHYDSINSSSSQLDKCPGADDNGSGTAAVMEAARCLSRGSFDCTLEFVLFSCEEIGLYGSKHQSQVDKAANAQIVGMIDLDMVAYADRMPEDLDVICNDASSSFGDRFIAGAAPYVSLPMNKVVDASVTYSDHSPYWDQGYPAFCGIEDFWPVNPNYHKASDTISTLNFDFFTDVVRATVASAAVMAGPRAVGVAGDLNGDGQLTSQDLVLMAGLLSANSTLTADQLRLADLDGSGEADLVDLVLMAQRIVG